MKRLWILAVVVMLLALPMLAVADEGAIGTLGMGDGTVAAMPYLPCGAGTPSSEGWITFDDLNHCQCRFDGTWATRNEYNLNYQQFGVVFWGRAGGGSLHECSEFGVSGYSRPVFMAFNSRGVFKNGEGPASSPELIIFRHGTDWVSFTVGIGFDISGDVEAVALSRQMTVLDQAKVRLGAEMQEVRLEGSDIFVVVVDASNSSHEDEPWVLDELRWGVDG